jgi:hypothetical protein
MVKIVIENGHIKARAGCTHAVYVAGRVEIESIGERLRAIHGVKISHPITFA